MESPQQPVPRLLSRVSWLTLMLGQSLLTYIIYALSSMRMERVKAVRVPADAIADGLMTVGIAMGRFWYVPAVLLILFYFAWVRKSCERQIRVNAIYCGVLILLMVVWTFYCAFNAEGPDSRGLLWIGY